MPHFYDEDQARDDHGRWTVAASADINHGRTPDEIAATAAIHAWKNSFERRHLVIAGNHSAVEKKEQELRLSLYGHRVARLKPLMDAASKRLAESPEPDFDKQVKAYHKMKEGTLLVNAEGQLGQIIKSAITEQKWWGGSQIVGHDRAIRWLDTGKVKGAGPADKPGSKKLVAVTGDTFKHRQTIGKVAKGKWDPMKKQWMVAEDKLHHLLELPGLKFDGKGADFGVSDDVREQLLAVTAVGRSVAFGNDHHDERGRFAPTGGSVYKPRRDPSYYGQAVGGISQASHQFLTDWQDSPMAMPTADVIKELGRYVPDKAVTLYRGGTPSGTAPLKSWSHSEEVASGFADDGEKVMKRTWYPNEVLVDFGKLPAAYRKDLDDNGMGTSLQEVVVAYGDFAKRLKQIRG